MEFNNASFTTLVIWSSDSFSFLLLVYSTGVVAGVAYFNTEKLPANRPLVVSLRLTFDLLWVGV
jgi:hypothetical protein